MGGYSQIICEMELFKEAHKYGPYTYYHLLSGVDLPIKSQDYIHRFFDEHQGKEFIGYTELSNESKTIRRRVGRYWVMESYFRTGNLLMKAIRKGFNILVGLIPRKMDMQFRFGCNWVSITENCVRHLLDNEKRVVKRFKRCFLVDEIFLHTIVAENKTLFENRFFKGYHHGSDYEGCMRLIDWSRGKPYTWTSDDKEELRQTDRLFARKFSEDDMSLIYWVRDELAK